MEGPLIIQALAIDFQHIYYQCPFELNTVHFHGNDTKSLLNREDEERCSHCRKCTRDVCLVVSDFTRRCGMRQSPKGKWKWDKASERELKRSQLS